jgi:hypothetical protein
MIACETLLLRINVPLFPSFQTSVMASKKSTRLDGSGVAALQTSKRLEAANAMRTFSLGNVGVSPFPPVKLPKTQPQIKAVRNESDAGANVEGMLSQKKLGSESARKDNRGSVGDIEELGETPTRFRDEETASLRKSLLSWYDLNHRELPWRINLHSQLNAFPPQTQEVAPPKKRRKKEIAEFPTLRAGPAAPPEESMKGNVLELVKAAKVEDRAYAVWVSEIMAQQTRISVVVDYYRKWMHKWPSVADLARASQEVSKSVQGRLLFSLPEKACQWGWTRCSYLAAMLFPCELTHLPYTLCLHTTLMN